MKKIIIALMVCACAVMAQSAQVNWKIGAGPTTKRLLGQDGNVFSGTAYLVYTADVGTITSDLAQGKSVSGAIDSCTTFNATTGAMTAQDTPNTISATSATDFSIILVQTISDKTYYKVSDKMTAVPSADLTTTPANLSWTASTNFSGSFTQAAPEPTSGLLLLLGMAGLVLRRKQK